MTVRSTLPRLAAGILLALAVAACSSAGAAPLPSDAPTSPPTSEGPGVPAVVSIAASAMRFDRTELVVPAGVPFELRFDNSGDTAPHNVAIRDGDSALFEGELIDGGETVVYKVGPIEAGTYAFRCDIHPDMKGTVSAR